MSAAFAYSRTCSVLSARRQHLEFHAAIKCVGSVVGSRTDEIFARANAVGDGALPPYEFAARWAAARHGASRFDQRNELEKRA